MSLPHFLSLSCSFPPHSHHLRISSVFGATSFCMLPTYMALAWGADTVWRSFATLVVLPFRWRCVGGDSGDGAAAEGAMDTASRRPVAKEPAGHEEEDEADDDGGSDGADDSDADDGADWNDDAWKSPSPATKKGSSGAIAKESSPAAGNAGHGSDNNEDEEKEEGGSSDASDWGEDSWGAGPPLPSLPSLPPCTSLPQPLLDPHLRSLLVVWGVAPALCHCSRTSVSMSTLGNVSRGV